MTGQPLEFRWDTAEVLRAWIEQLPGGYVFTVQDAVSTLELASRSVRRQLPRFAPDLVTIVPGTGGKARPLQFQRVASLAVLPEPLPAMPSMPLPEDEQDREEEPTADLPEAPGAGALVLPKVSARPEPAGMPSSPEPDAQPAWSLSPRAQVLTLLQERPSLQWYAEEIHACTELTRDVVDRTLNALLIAGVVARTGDARDPAYSLNTAPPQLPLSAESRPPVPLPARLTFDERCVFEALRREPRGLSRRLLGARLNWSNSRTDRVTAALEAFHHIEEVGGRLQVVSPSA